MDSTPSHKATCHCGAVELQLTLTHGIDSPSRCNCSMCSRRGTMVCSVPLADLKVVKGAQTLTLYQFGSMTAKHYFCSICGIHTHHQRRSDPTKYGVNVGCIEGADPFAFEPVPIYDGINHAADGAAD